MTTSCKSWRSKTKSTANGFADQSLYQLVQVPCQQLLAAGEVSDSDDDSSMSYLAEELHLKSCARKNRQELDQKVIGMSFSVQGV